MLQPRGWAKEGGQLVSNSDILYLLFSGKENKDRGNGIEFYE